jgi:hypothetical protein
MKSIRIGVIINNRYGTIKNQMLSGIEEAHRQLKDYGGKICVTKN